jgi:hypothetical protein
MVGSGDTSDRLNQAARESGWKTSRLRANGGKVAVDWFAHDRVLLKLVYDARGRLIEALHYDGKKRLGRSHQLGARDPDKVKTVLKWIKAEAK